MQDLGIRLKQDAIAQLRKLFDQALSKVAEKQLVARALTVKIKYHDFVQITRSRPLPDNFTAASTTVGIILEELVKNTDLGRRNVRLLGVTLSSLENKSGQTRFQQMDLFSDAAMAD